MKNKPVDPAQLPQTGETWFICLRPLDLDLGDKNAKPTIMILSDLTEEQILRMDVYDTPPKAGFIHSLLLQTMSQPEQGDLLPRRPKEVIFEQADLLDEIAPALKQIHVAASHGTAPPVYDALIGELIHTFGASPVQLAGLLSVPETNPKMIAGLFEAAAGFYRAAPWKRIADYQTLAVTIDPPGQQLFVQVMGNGGMEFGLSLYTAWEDVLRMFEAADSPLELLPETGMHGLTFETKSDMPAEDQAAMRKYGWKTAGSKACPMPVVFTQDGQAERPARQELLYYEALLRGLPAFIEKHLVDDGAGDFEPAQAAIASHHSDGAVLLTMRYPAGEMPEFDEDQVWVEEDEETLDLPAELLEANRLADQAWRETDVDERLRLARQALELSPDCCEACLVLAYETETPEAAQEWLEMAVQAGERTLGQDFIEANMGELYYWREARPYLRALDGLAENLEELGRIDEALAQYQSLLALNEEDHQGVRYDAIRLLLLLKRHEEAAELLDEYEGEGTATWAYSRALLAFRQSGDISPARSELKKALRTNRHVPAYLTGATPLPEEAPVAIGIGDESDAIDYALKHYALWWATPGAVDWLKRHR